MSETIEKLTKILKKKLSLCFLLAKISPDFVKSFSGERIFLFSSHVFLFFWMTEKLEITEMLVRWKNGDEQAIESLLPQVEKELRRIAARQLRREQANHTLQTTALINEAYLKLIKQSDVNWQNRAQFFGISAKIMRRILINYARDAKAVKRGGEEVKFVNLDDAVVFTPEKSEQLINLDEALMRLEKFDHTKSRIVEMRFFSGMSIEDTAEALDMSPSSVSHHWRLARAWLKKEIGG